MMNIARRHISVLTWCGACLMGLLLTPSLSCGEPAPAPSPAAAYAAEGSRYALLVSNGTGYKGIFGNLQAPSNDVKVLSESLKKADFQVDVKSELNKDQLEKAIQDFALKLRLNKASAGLFYFSGHGVEANHVNYLVPITPDEITVQSSVPSYAVDADNVCKWMDDSECPMRILVFDACRAPVKAANALKSGLSAMEAGGGSIIIFSAAPHLQAKDGVFAPLLARNIDTSRTFPVGQTLNEVITATTNDVVKQTGEFQRPYVTSSLTTDFRFYPKFSNGEEGDAGTFEAGETLLGHAKQVDCVAFSPDGSLIATGSNDNSLKLWNAKTGEQLCNFSGDLGWVATLSFSPNGETIASAGESRGTINISDVKSGELLKTFEINLPRIYALTYSPDGKTLAATGWGDGVFLINAKSGRLIQRLEDTSESPAKGSLCFSPDGLYIAGPGHNKSVKIWNVKSGQVVHTFSPDAGPVVTVKYSPDGKTLAFSGDRTIRIWNIDLGSQIQVLTGRSGSQSVAFNPDGNLLASGGMDHTLHIWDVASGKELQAISAHEDVINSVAFSPDGQTIATAGDDSIAKLWRKSK